MKTETEVRLETRPVLCSQSEIKKETVLSVKEENEDETIIDNKLCEMTSEIKTIHGDISSENKSETDSVSGPSEAALCSRPILETETPVKKRKMEDKDNDIYGFGLKNMPEEYKETYEAFIRQVKALSAVPILKSLPEESIRNFRPYTERYYEDRYCIDFGTVEKRYCDINIRVHSNKLFLISLASGNDIIRSQRDILKINFVINNVDRSNVNLRGKKKFGSKTIERQTILCQVQYEGDEKMYNIRAGVNGRIIEINELIKKNPNLIRTHPKGLGFIAVISPKGNPHEYEARVNKMNLLSEEQYFKHLLQRMPKHPNAI